MSQQQQQQQQQLTSSVTVASLRLAPLDTTVTKPHLKCVQPPISPPPTARFGVLPSQLTPLASLPSTRPTPPPLPPTSITTSPPPPLFSTPLQKINKPRRKRARNSRDVFQCPYPNCHKTTSEHSNLKAHMRLHTGETPYVCNRPNCGKRFRWKSSLTYHEKALHSNLRPFACHACNKRFVEKRKLQLHLDWCPTRHQLALAANVHRPLVPPISSQHNY